MSVSAARSPLLAIFLAWGGFAENNATFIKIIRRHFYLNAVTHHRSDTVSPHFSRCIRDQLMVVVQMDAKAPIRQHFFDESFKDERVFLGQNSDGFKLGR